VKARAFLRSTGIGFFGSVEPLSGSSPAPMRVVLDPACPPVLSSGLSPDTGPWRPAHLRCSCSGPPASRISQLGEGPTGRGACPPPLSHRVAILANPQPHPACGLLTHTCGVRTPSPKGKSSIAPSGAQTPFLSERRFPSRRGIPVSSSRKGRGQSWRYPGESRAPRVRLSRANR
jgi:hypothetical protein